MSLFVKAARYARKNPVKVAIVVVMGILVIKSGGIHASLIRIGDYAKQAKDKILGSDQATA